MYTTVVLFCFNLSSLQSLHPPPKISVSTILTMSISNTIEIAVSPSIVREKVPY
jgi:hypothetical protein